jgi:putative oxidoreductase
MFGILNCDCSSKWGGYAPLVLRVVTGLIFAMHGYQKLTQMGVSGVAGFLDGLGFPLASVFAVILIAVELLGGLALIAGFMTHWAAKLCAIVAVVALFTVHIANGFFMSGNGYEFILLILAASVSLMISGPGAFSVDGMRKPTVQQ